jgi:hypothetical protein
MKSRHRSKGVGGRDTAVTGAKSIIVMACAVLAGCSTLLPRATFQSVSPFATFDSAREAFERIVPYRTTLPELKQLGFDVATHGNVLQVPYPQLVGQLVPNPVLTFDRLDAGIRDCIAAQQECRAFVFRAGTEVQQRSGPFMQDFLNFRRVTRTHGWRFEGVVLVRGGVVLFRNHGGEPLIDRVEQRVNPLGPLQAVGGAAVRDAVLP